MKTPSALLLLSSLVQLAGAQWVLQPRVTVANLYQVRFVDRNNGWIVGQYYVRSGIRIYPANISIMLRTTNAGASWPEQRFTNQLLYSISFPNRSVGWAVGAVPSGRGLMCKTTDGGTTWKVIDSSSTDRFYCVQFLNESIGWIGGWNDTAGVVTRTTDGGVTWHTLHEKALDVNELFFLDPMNGWAVGENGKIYKTLDGGANWQAVYQVPGYASPLRRIRFPDRLHGCAVGGIAGIETKVWTTDGGVTWNAVMSSPPTPGSSLHGLWLNDPNNGWCVGGVNAGLTIQQTTDGGKTWSKQDYPSSLNSSLGYFEDVTFTTPTEGWIVADSGYILKTMTGGITPLYATAHRVSLDRYYARPARDSICIRTVLEDPSHHVAALSAIVVDTLGAVRDSVRLYNDALHGDGSVGDSVWGCRILAPPDEGRFTVSVLANDTTFGMVTLIPDVQQFYTNGPIVYKGWTTSSTSDTIASPGSVIRVRIRLANAGKSATVRNVTATISALDTMVYIGTVVQLSYGDIASGQESLAPATQGLRIQSYCPPNTTVRLLISISTEGFPAWTDTASIVVQATATEVASKSTVPTAFSLRQNYPNPFNPSTTITFSVPASSFVSLRVLDLLGRDVATLVSDVLPAGTHTRRWNAGGFPSGVYYYQLRVGSICETKKLVLLR
jgi:photosystem II stability/assembly factor-like uncharacterized protein